MRTFVQGDTYDVATEKWVATSPYTGATETFRTRGAAEFWLWLISERVESERARYPRRLALAA